MLRDNKIWVANNDAGEGIFLLPRMANRHGLIAGATGTGKTVTARIMAESFSEMGVPVFMAEFLCITVVAAGSYQFYQIVCKGFT